MHQNKFDQFSHTLMIALCSGLTLPGCALSTEPAADEPSAVSVQPLVARPCPVFPQVNSCHWVTSLGNSGAGSLRQAIEDANNSTSAVRRILFDLPSAPAILHPDSSLPQLNGNIRLEGYSQPGSAPGTEDSPPIVGVAIDCAQCGTSGLRLSGSGNVVSGISVYNVPQGSGIVALGEGGHTIVGNSLGALYLPAWGWLLLANSQAGLNVNGSNNNQVGGVAVGDRNVISGNGVQGAIIAGTGNRVVNNAFGTDFVGTQDLHNGGDGIFVYGSGNSIGGIDPGEGNQIAFNGDNGVVVALGTGNKISRNFIHHNLQQAIDLNDDGHTNNDGPLDADEGPNGLQNFPRITSVTRGAGDAPTIAFYLNTQPNRSIRVELFKSSFCGARDAGQAESLVGTGVVHPDASGHVEAVFGFNTPVHAGEYLSATAVDLTSKDTSELSRCFLVP